MTELSFSERMLTLVGDQNPVEVLGHTSDQLASIVAANSTNRLRARPIIGKWTPNEILGHLADNELVMGFRIRTILFEDNVVLSGYSQDTWVARQEHNQQEPEKHIAVFNRLRSDNLQLWQAMTEAEAQKSYQRRDRRPESLGQLLMMHAGHDLSHLDQLKRYLEANSRDFTV